MSKEQKQMLHEVKERYDKVNDDFLDCFQKRFIIFIEDGADLGKFTCMENVIDNDYGQVTASSKPPINES